MTGESATALLTINSIQLLLSQLNSFIPYGAFYDAAAPTISTILSTSFDYVIVGGGSSGLVVANRLSACSDANVLVLEAGGCPTMESLHLGLFTLLTNSGYDYNLTSTNDTYSCQNLQNGVATLNAGKVLGGSSSVHHGIWVRGSEEEYNDWATASGNSSWNYAGLLPYFLKGENISDPEVLAESASYCGTNGQTKLTRAQSSSNTNITKAWVELGYEEVKNCNADKTSGVICEPLVQVGDMYREGSFISYLYKAKDRSNLYVLTGATVSKINFDDTEATGVTFTYESSSYTVNVSKEVVLAAGALHTPQLLMLSGVGPSDHLKEIGIDVISDLPVGNNLQDHPQASIVVALQTDTSTTAGSNYLAFPVALTTTYTNLSNSTSQKAEYQAINLIFPHDSSGLLQLCANGFRYSNEICDAMYAASNGRQLLWAVLNLLHPKSTGTVRLSDNSMSSKPIVKLGLMSNSTDLDSLAKFVAHAASIVNTTTFKEIGAELVDLGVCTDQTKYTDEYFKCYALAMSSSMWHYCGTAAMGSVVDDQLLVKGITKLRVVDASVFPYVPGGNINAAVIGVAEKASDMIISDRSSCSA